MPRKRDILEAGLSAFMFRSKGTLIIRRRGRFYKVLRTRHLGDNWWTFECKDLDTKKDAFFDYQVLGMWEVLDKASTMKDPKDILLIDLDQQGKWAIRTRQELEQYFKRAEKKQRN